MILLTGAAGFIGSNILKELNTRKINEIICVDDLTNGLKCANLSGAKFYDYYDCEELFLQRFPFKILGIIHMGAHSGTRESNGREVIANNFSYTKRLLKLANNHNCPIIYASSASVYGNGKNGFKEEEQCERPNSPYSISKWMIDQYVRRHKISAVGLRYFNVYGPGETHKTENASFAHKFFTAAKTRNSVEIFDHPTEKIYRDFIYVKDAVDITLFCLFNKFVPGVYNVGTGVAHSFNTVLNTGVNIIQESNLGGWNPKVYRQTLPEKWLKQYQMHTCADISKLKMLGWNKTLTTLQDGMQQHWEHMTNEF